MKRITRLLVPLLITVLLLGSLGYGLWIWYDNNIDRSGWVEEDGVRFYRDFYGDPVTGWLDLEAGRYYLEAGGIPVTGWREMNGVTYWFRQDGVMHTGWLEQNGKTYFFTDTGAMTDGWLHLDTGRYYLQEGVLLTGWQEIGGDAYYFAESGIMVLNFAEIDGQMYYFGTDGILTTGMETINERVFYFGEDGVMRTGWDDTPEGRRYFYEDGPMARGWTNIGEDLYYFHEDGVMQSGWMAYGEYRCYFREDGRAARGPLEVDGQVRYFTPKGIEIVLVNALNPVPDDYELDLEDWNEDHQVARRCYEALAEMLEDCNEAGIQYTFNSAYRTIKVQTEILELRTAEHMLEYELTFEEAREKALETVAVPGTSEHHLGLAVDLLGQEAIAWLTEHCWDYGFIVRYQGDKYEWTGIVSEPWHFRYVGVEVAQDIRQSGLCLEEYLGAEPVKGE